MGRPLPFLSWLFRKTFLRSLKQFGSKSKFPRSPVQLAKIRSQIIKLANFHFRHSRNFKKLEIERIQLGKFAIYKFDLNAAEKRKREVKLAKQQAASKSDLKKNKHSTRSAATTNNNNNYIDGVAPTTPTDTSSIEETRNSLNYTQSTIDSSILPTGADNTPSNTNNRSTTVDSNSSFPINNEIFQRNDIVILYFHGGAFCLNTPIVYSDCFYALTSGLGCSIFAPDYRLSYENVFPSSLDDCFEAYRYLIEDLKFDPAKIVIAGDSAGGNMAVALHMKIINEGQLPPASCLVLFSPWLDLSQSGPSYLLNAKSDLLINRKSIEKAAHLYLNGNFDYNEPKLSHPEKYTDFCMEFNLKQLQNGDLSSLHFNRLFNPYVSPAFFENGIWTDKFPTTLIHVAAEELLLSDSLIFARRMNNKTADDTAITDSQLEFIPSSIQGAAIALSEELGKMDINTKTQLKKSKKWTYATGCNPTAESVKVAVKIWKNEFHAFPAFGPADRPNSTLCLNDCIEWIKNRFK